RAADTREGPATTGPALPCVRGGPGSARRARGRRRRARPGRGGAAAADGAAVAGRLRGLGARVADLAVEVLRHAEVLLQLRQRLLRELLQLRVLAALGLAFEQLHR